MKSLLKYIFLAISGNLFLLACDLKRDNLLEGDNDIDQRTAQVGYYSHTVVVDNNDDGIINNGETVYLLVDLKNSGSKAAMWVEATFSTTSSYASDFAPTTQVDYSNILAGSTQDSFYGVYGYVPTPAHGKYTIKFTVSNTTPDKAKIPIDISIVDGNGNTWSSSFDVTVQN
ncbi:MAG: hypothetical protein LBK97_07290 [Prevotellaceae bacterium]|nr:hypothetical protein [Prevotellaceae bacterium]